jgi:hypothetical protein
MTTPGGDHSPRQVQVADQAAAPLAQATTGGEAGDWASEVGSPDGSVLAQGQLGDALHAVLCAAGYNLRWLLRAMVRLGLKAAFLRPVLLVLIALSTTVKWARFDLRHQNFRLAGMLG